MNAEIISIGDELLIGQIANTNASFIADKLTEIGINIKWITAVGDNQDQIFESVTTAEKRSNVIVVTGGLGPTHDDITKDVFVKYFQSNLVLDETLLQELRQRFKKRKIKMVHANEGQALVPDNASIITNKLGTAPGLLFNRNNKFFFVLPGVPVEMEKMIENFVVPFLKNKNKRIIKKRVLHLSGIPESTLFEKLGDINQLEKQAKIAFLPHFGMVDIRLTASGFDEQACLQKVKNVEKIIQEKVGANIWGVDEETIEELILNKIIKQRKTLSIIEYGTRGEIIAKLTKNQNPEKYFIQGLVVCSFPLAELCPGNSDLEIESGIKKSEEIAKYLAAKIKTKTNSDLGLAIVHNHQSDAASFIALSDAGQTHCWKNVFPHKSDIAIRRIVIATLHHLFHYLSSKKLA